MYLERCEKTWRENFEVHTLPTVTCMDFSRKSVLGALQKTQNFLGVGYFRDIIMLSKHTCKDT